MASTIYRQLLIQSIQRLREHFDRSESIFRNGQNELFHAGEFGQYREEAVIELLRLSIPQTYGITKGFVITRDDQISTQCDLIVYDKQSCPNLVDSSHTHFIPVEAVVAIGEVKSQIRTSSDMSDILHKLAANKALKSLDPQTRLTKKIYAPDEKNECMFDSSFYRHDAIFTFVICKSFSAMPSAGFSYDGNVDMANKHNFIASLEAGHCAYYANPSWSIFGGTHNYHYPHTRREAHDQEYKEPIEDEVPLAIGLLVSALYNHCKLATLVEFDPVEYIATNIRR
ncbi:DUF6602 domain-containing protein [Vibrio parahaemolyticus]|uniref:DUF6602 domain-containing protein n=1 Tax=Vibrio parahaemolyticus TaxID=670 RepID=UPI0011212FD6|nr:DUF6602 domain-containing protein [Vibrio parahaemolyticus]ELC3208582.1 hypothetical protein [Vibrio parahaemolyticus]TPA68561.1 hypothetical protein DXJ77_24880 [Vibrio parahaemolyticus]